MKQPFLFPELSEDDGTINTVFKVTSYGADFDVAGLIRRLKEKKIIVPEYQRQYVWNITKASRFIESLLLGLPVPGVFLTKNPDNEVLEIVDGQQRLLTLLYFFEGTFKPHSSDRQPFKLQGVGNKFLDYSYSELPREDKIRLEDTPIHATIIKQESPEQETENSLFYIFERLNSGGVELNPQEIRSAIYPGSLLAFVKEFNLNKAWRSLMGTSHPHERQRDEEILLRFISLYSDIDSFVKVSLTQFLNNFLRKNKNMDGKKLDELKTKLIFAIEKIIEHPSSISNVAALEAIVVALMKNNKVKDISSKIDKLMGTRKFINAINQGTGKEERVKRRVEIAQEILK